MAHLRKVGYPVAHTRLELKAMMYVEQNVCWAEGAFQDIFF